MRLKRIDISKTNIQLTVTAEPSEMAAIKDRVLRHMAASHVKIAGFREGKAPLNLVEKQVNPNQLQTEFLEEAINQLYVRAIDSEKLRAVEQPKISVKKFVPFTDLEFEADVEVVGKITLGGYKSIKKTKKPVALTDKDIEEVITALKKRLAQKKEVKRASRDGDEVLIDFNGVDDKGIPVNGAKGKDYPLVLGSNSLIPGFEPNLLGLKAGEEKTFIITFPGDYGVAALQNKKVTFRVVIQKVQELNEPEVNDSFAAQAGPFKTLRELKNDIKKQLTLEREQEAQGIFENELLQDIASKSTVEIPKVLVDDQIERAEREERQNLTYRGQTWQEHLAQEGVTEEEHRERNRPTAAQSVKIGLMLSEIAEKEKITLTPEELEIRLQILKGQYRDPSMRAELEKPEARNDVASRLITEKTIAKLVDYATNN